MIEAIDAFIADPTMLAILENLHYIECHNIKHNRLIIGRGRKIVFVVQLIG